MAKKVEIELDIKGGDKVEGLGAEIRRLNKELRQTPEGTKEWKQLYNKIDDLKDKLEGSKKASKDLFDTLESAPGPIGALGKGLNSLKVATTSFGAALKATGIGLLVSIIGGLVAAFSQSETAMKKLEPLWIGLQKILGGIMEVFQPLLDAFLELALKALPYITKYIGTFYSSLVALFTLVKEAGIGVGKILKGVFTLDFDSLEAGYKQLTGSWDKTVKSFKDGMARYEDGTKKMTKTEKENLEERTKKRQEALEKALKSMEAQNKLDEAQLEKQKQIALAAAETEQEKLDIEKKFAKLSYDEKIKDVDAKLKLYKDDKDKTKELLAEKAKLEADNIKQTSDFKKQQGDIDKKNNEEKLSDELVVLQKNLSDKKLTQEQYEDSVYQTKKKYTTDKKALDQLEIEYQKTLDARKKKQADDDRALAFSVLQDQIDVLDKLNAKRDDDFAEDNKRLEAKKQLLLQQEQMEIDAAEGNAQKQLEIKKKYADAVNQIEVQITNNEKAQAEQRRELKLLIADDIERFGAFLQQVAGKNKALAKSGLIVEQAAGVAKIVINTQANAAKAGYLTPKGIAEIAAGLIGVATAVAATIKGIRQIDASDSGNASTSTGGENMGKNYGDGGMIDGPRHAQGGTLINAEGGEAIMTRGAVTMFKPLLSMLNQAGGGTSFTAGATGRPNYDAPQTSNPSLSQEPMIVKTYVVSHELTTTAERQAKLKDLSTL